MKNFLENLTGITRVGGIFWALILTVGAAGNLWAQNAEAEYYAAPNRPAVSPISGESIGVKVADLKQDTESNRQDVKALALRVEQLEREKAAMEQKLGQGGAAYATKEEMKLLEARMNDAVAAEGKRVQEAILADMKAAASASAKATSDVTSASATQNKMKGLAEAGTPVANPKKTADASAGKIQVSEAEKQSYMKEGIRYTVQPGDTLSSIAKKNHSSVRAIMAVNEISAPNKIFVGKELFVPTL